jgi:hypothetical protein
MHFWWPRMTYNRLHARALLNASELALFERSVGNALADLTPLQLRREVKRASTLRDKCRDLLRRQKLATRSRTGSKSGTSGDANARTQQKVKLFEEVLQRLNRQQAKIEAEERRKAERESVALARASIARSEARQDKISKPRSSKQRAAVPVAKPKKMARSSATTAAQRSQMASARTKVIQTHLAARGRRQQAARDKRR